MIDSFIDGRNHLIWFQDEQWSIESVFANLKEKIMKK